jgi:hypothetical protein
MSRSSSASSFGSSPEKRRRLRQDERDGQLHRERGTRLSLLTEMTMLKRVCSTFKRQSKIDVPGDQSRMSKLALPALA